MPHCTATFILREHPTDAQYAAVGEMNDDIIFGTDRGKPIAEYDGDFPSPAAIIFSGLAYLNRVGLDTVNIHAWITDDAG